MKRKKRAAPATARRIPVWLLCLLALYALVLAVLTVSNHVGPETWWFGNVNLYLPQWLWALPGIALAALVGLYAPRALWLPVLLLMWVAGPIMGLSWSLARPLPKPGALRLRVMTFNAKFARRGVDNVLGEVTAAQPDLLFMQDAASGGIFTALMRSLPGFQLQGLGQYVIASRYPFSAQPVTFPFPGSIPPNFTVVRCVVRTPEGPIVVYTAHTVSPRWALVGLKREGAEGLDALRANTTLRLAEAAELAVVARRETGPVVVVGDLNAPVQSLVCKRLFAAGLRDAFSEAGRGYGYTYGRFLPWRHSFVRIDHVLVSRHFVVTDCRSGGSGASDHCPVIADLALDTP